ncbi:MAG: molybdenum cofactor biosynthesis protein MoaE [Firmicutes bacterium]|nr:molybdenum cofactor biosynthesis protein MoaE [Bacillota bacterium]
MRYRITSAGKRCFEACQLLQRTGEKCPLASGVSFGKLVGPSMDCWMEEIRERGGDPRIGMYLTHNGVVRMTSRAMAREGAEGTDPVTAMDFSYDAAELDSAVADTYRMPGIYYIRTWLAEGRLEVGDNIMYVLIGGDIRPNVTAALDYLVGRIKERCVTETEITE